MLNNLGARVGEDFRFQTSEETLAIKNKLPNEILIFWADIESHGMDVIAADGHPLGRTFKFVVDISQSEDFEDYIKDTKEMPVYDAFAIAHEAIVEEEADEVIGVVTDVSELNTVRTRIQEIKNTMARLNSELIRLEAKMPTEKNEVLVTFEKKKTTDNEN